MVRIKYRYLLVEIVSESEKIGFKELFGNNQNSDLIKIIGEKIKNETELNFGQLIQSKINNSFKII